MTFILELSSWWSGNVHPVYQARRHGKRGGGGVRWSPAASPRVCVCEDRAVTGRCALWPLLHQTLLPSFAGRCTGPHSPCPVDNGTWTLGCSPASWLCLDTSGVFGEPPDPVSAELRPWHWTTHICVPPPCAKPFAGVSLSPEPEPCTPGGGSLTPSQTRKREVLKALHVKEYAGSVAGLGLEPLLFLPHQAVSLCVALDGHLPFHLHRTPSYWVGHLMKIPPRATMPYCDLAGNSLSGSRGSNGCITSLTQQRRLGSPLGTTQPADSLLWQSWSFQQGCVICRQGDRTSVHFITSPGQEDTHRNL